jgi:hypothetical protein
MCIAALHFQNVVCKLRIRTIWVAKTARASVTVGEKE